MKKQAVIATKIILMMLAIAFYSCGSSTDKSQENKWANSKWHKLQDENIKLRLLTQFKASSRYRVKQDLPFLSEDTTQLRLIQNSLELLEFEDSAIDVFVDNSKAYKLLVICNTQKIDFTKSDASILKKQLELSNQKNGADNPTFNYGLLTAKMKANSKLKLARYTTPISNKLNGRKVYNSIYYLTSDSYTLIIYEFSEDEDSIEDFLWTTKVG